MHCKVRGFLHPNRLITAQKPFVPTHGLKSSLGILYYVATSFLNKIKFIRSISFSHNLYFFFYLSLSSSISLLKFLYPYTAIPPPSLSIHLSMDFSLSNIHIFFFILHGPPISYYHLFSLNFRHLQIISKQFLYLHDYLY
jgi:hypothetical protein